MHISSATADLRISQRESCTTGICAGYCCRPAPAEQIGPQKDPTSWSSWEGCSHPPDGVLHASLLPWRVGTAEEGLDTQVMELVVPCEFGAVIEGDGLTPLRWQGSQHPCHGRGYMGAEAFPCGLRAMSSREWRSCMVSTACP